MYQNCHRPGLCPRLRHIHSHISAAIRDELHWLPIRRSIDFKIALLVRHCLVGAAPEYLMELCHPVGSAVGRQCLRSASRGDLVVPRFRLQTFGHRAFAVSGPQIWNSLPLSIRQSRDNLLLFKQKLKAHLFLWLPYWIIVAILNFHGRKIIEIEFLNPENLLLGIFLYFLCQ